MELKKKLDLSSFIVIVLTFILFAGAIISKGISHDLLLEAGIFLVSIKLIFMAYKNKIMEKEIKEKLENIEILIKNNLK